MNLNSGFICKTWWSSAEGLKLGQKLWISIHPSKAPFLCSLPETIHKLGTLLGMASSLGEPRKSPHLSLHCLVETCIPCLQAEPPALEGFKWTLSPAKLAPSGNFSGRTACPSQPGATPSPCKVWKELISRGYKACTGPITEWEPILVSGGELSENSLAYLKGCLLWLHGWV